MLTTVILLSLGIFKVALYTPPRLGLRQREELALLLLRAAMGVMRTPFSAGWSSYCGTAPVMYLDFEYPSLGSASTNAFG